MIALAMESKNDFDKASYNAIGVWLEKNSGLNKTNEIAGYLTNRTGQRLFIAIEPCAGITFVVITEC